MRRLEESGRWGLEALPTCPACFSPPFPALPCPAQPHGSVSWSRACTRGQPSSTRAAREEPRQPLPCPPAPPAPDACPWSTPSPEHPTARSIARSIPQLGPSPQPGASLPVPSPLPIPNFLGSLKHSSSPEQSCSPESLWESLAASLHPWKHPCSPGHP